MFECEHDYHPTGHAFQGRDGVIFKVLVCKLCDNQLAQHVHHFHPYGEPFEFQGATYQRHRCVVCGGNTFTEKIG